MRIRSSSSTPAAGKWSLILMGSPAFTAFGLCQSLARVSASVTVGHRADVVDDKTLKAIAQVRRDPCRQHASPGLSSAEDPQRRASGYPGRLQKPGGEPYRWTPHAA